MKRKITLEDGRKVDCGIEEFDNLKQSIKEQDPDKIVTATIKVLLSSDDLMNDMVDKLKEFVKKKNDTT